MGAGLCPLASMRPWARAWARAGTLRFACTIRHDAELRVIDEEEAWSLGHPSATLGDMGQASEASEASVV